MPVILGILGLLAAAAFWMYRMRDAADTAGELLEMGRDVIGAAKRWNFRRTHNVHPVEGIEEARLAAGALAVSLVELGDMPTKEQRDALEEREGTGRPHSARPPGRREGPPLPA